MDEDADSFWQNSVHIVGKDILRFHAVYWPAFLMAAGLNPPKKIIAHGWITVDGEKMSKSLGNVINPYDLISQYGLDYVRYFLMRDIHIGNDGSFSTEVFVNRINSELANNIGNGLQRSLSLLIKYNDGIIPELNELELGQAYDHFIEYKNLMYKYDFSGALEIVVKLANQLNIYITQKEPWSLAKTNLEEMKLVLYNVLENLRIIALMFLPFIPDSANKMLDYLGVASDKRTFAQANFANKLKAYKLDSNISPIFPRIIY
jgi:methionyl-tRNA synthetase